MSDEPETIVERVKRAFGREDTGPDPMRRSILTGSAAATASAAGAALLGGGAQAQAENVASAPDDLLDVTFRLNDARITRGIDPRRTLLDLVRKEEGLTGTKVGCRHGQCGACTVHVNGEPRLACLTLAAQVEGKEVTTIEGLDLVAKSEGIATDAGLHPVQQAFIERDAFQCGYCTPGQIMSAVAIVKEGHANSAQEVREYMSGNLCRCAAYPNITAAVLDAKEKMGDVPEGGGARADYHLGLIETARSNASVDAATEN